MPRGIYDRSGKNGHRKIDLDSIKNKLDTRISNLKSEIASKQNELDILTRNLGLMETHPELVELVNSLMNVE